MAKEASFDIVSEVNMQEVCLLYTSDAADE